MSDAKHTPGPWKVVRNSRNCTLNVVSAPDVDGESVKIALVNYQDEGNANLIAAAPDMRDEITRLRAERDALLARLAPVDDEALVEIVGRTLRAEVFDPDVLKVYGDLWAYDEQRKILKQARAAIAAIRPHIEAAERERSSEFRGLFLELFGALKKVVATHHQCINLTPETISKFEDLISAAEAIAAAIRSRK